MSDPPVSRGGNRRSRTWGLVWAATAVLVGSACGDPAGRCGDGTCDPTESPRTCAADCPATGCGDGTCNGTESALTCPVDCWCGNGACEPGENQLACPADCHAAECGNGACEPGEDMNGCPGDCHAPECGNGACEPGEDTYGCAADCIPQCGNGILEAGEDCDGSVGPGPTCESVSGHTEGTLLCAPSCHFDTSRCSTCGDGQQQGDEECDRADLDGQVCSDLGFSGGTLACDDTCAFDSSDCNVCGDDVIQPPEVCDGTDFGAPPATCESLGHSGGTLACTAGCLHRDVTGCFDCGDGLCEFAKGEDAVVCPEDCGWTQVSAGAAFTCGIRVNDTAWCWGRGNNCQLADGACVDRSSPVEIPLLAGAGLTSISAAHGSHACALRSGRVYCWGWNGYGQIGNGTTIQQGTPLMVPTITDAVDLAAGGRHSCAVRPNLETWCWGAMEYGLGYAYPDDTCSPYGTEVECALSPLEVLNNDVAWLIRAGNQNVCTLNEWNPSRCWGGPWIWSEGVYYWSIEPSSVTNAGDGVDLAVSDVHACLVNSTGGVRCWGTNDFGQLGPNATDFGTDDAVSVPGLTPASLVAAGGYASTFDVGHTCVSLQSDGSLRCWGANQYGQLGDGTNTQSIDPVTVVGLTGVVKLEAGTSHTCAITDDHRLHCWGHNTYGALGDGTTNHSNVPVPVP